MTTNTVLMDVARERLRQMKKWGEQNHPLGMGPDTTPLNPYLNYEDATGETSAKDIADLFTALTDDNAKMGVLTWRDILLEEVFELLAEERADKVREEAIQVAAVAVAIVEYVDRTNR